ncbi:hypothetical protein EDB84DRAFT_876809 [Lactarius hengduanensis]|nr:hypothetical protein EDB84DRAFT_876809 [Lactarius hengduanensis]
MTIRQSTPTFMQSPVGQTSAPNPPPFLRFLVSCLISKHLDPVEKVLYEHFPKRSQTLAKYLSLTLSDFDIKPPLPPHDATCISSHRLGLNMSQEKFRMAKSLLSQYYIVSGYLKGVLHLKLSPYVVMYAAMDLDVPLPDDFDKWFLWRHIEQLLQLRRTANLVGDADILPPVLSGSTIPPEYMANVTEDPDGVLQRLYCSHHHTQTFYSSSFPEPKRPLSELPSIQLTLATTDRGTAGEMCSWNGGMVSHHWFGLRRQPSDLAFVSSREAYALLDATCCWGLSWRGRTVRVNLSNQRLVWALNDFTDASAEFPVVEVLLTLAARCGFEFTAVYSYSPLHHASVDRHAQGQYNRFSEGSGLALPLMDVVLSDVPFAKGNLCDLEVVVLSTYRAILAGCGSHGYTGGLYNPGSLYSEMRSKQAFVVVEDTWHTSRKRSPLEDPVTHLSPPDWKRVLERRLGGETPDVLDGDCIPAPLLGTLVATRVRDPPSTPIFHVRCTPEAKIEAQKRRTRKIVQARESAMRLRAVGDDAACAATDMTTFDRWSGPCSD